MTVLAAAFNDRSKPIFTLANKITLARVLAVPFIVIALIENYPWTGTLLLITFLSDFFDGVAARVRGERTLLGAFLDPMADKLLLTAVFMILAYRGIIPAWAFVVIFSRDLLIVLGWFVIYILTSSHAIMPRSLGKLSTAAQMTAACAYVMNIPAEPARWLMWAAVACTIASVIDYVIIGERRLGG
jgi:cardiolipin synthase